MTSSSQWAFLPHRRRTYGLDGAIVLCVLDWWKNETRISPNRNDVTKKQVAPKMYNEHTTHLLLETQVRLEFFYASYLFESLLWLKVLKFP